jgi:hypothetical protein
MQINWAKGFFRAWAVLAIVWVLASGWHAYTTTYWSFQSDNDCWKQLAKWPDGKAFDSELDRFLDWVPDPPEPAFAIEIEKNRWRRMIWQKIEDCRASKPLVQRVARAVTMNWSSLESSLQLILLPPLAVLIAGGALGWIIRGFRAKQP